MSNSFLIRYPEVAAGLKFVEAEFQYSKIPGSKPASLSDMPTSFLLLHPEVAEGLNFIQAEYKYSKLPGSKPASLKTTGPISTNVKGPASPPLAVNPAKVERTVTAKCTK